MPDLRNDIRECGAFGIVDRDCSDLHDDTLDEIIKIISDPLQHKIDWLMLEYCPDEMTKEQMDNWGKHQVKAGG